MNETGREESEDELNESSELYAALRILPVTVEDITSERTTVRIQGEGYTGFGEDTTPSIEAHDRLRNERFPVVTGEPTVGTFASINDTELHVADHTPQRGDCNHLQWAIESAVLDLALKQSGQTLAGFSIKSTSR